MREEIIQLGPSGWGSAADEQFNPVPEKKDFRSKRLDQMTAEEIKQKWMTEKPEDFEQIDPAYSMPLDELRQKADEQLRQEAEKALDAKQTANAITWMATEKRYRKTPKNAELIEQFIKKNNMAGTVTDFATVFDILDQKGLLETNPVEPSPVKLYTREELMAMPVDKAREVVEDAHRKGIF